MPGSSAPTLHVAALPFPSPQGTQAAVRAMLDALHEAGRPARLLTYAHGTEGPPMAFEHVRLAHAFGDGSLRSGPSLTKIAQDLALAAALARGAPALVVAHHVEAAFAAWLARRPYVFVAHTALGPELPTYLHRRFERLGAFASASGAGLEALLARGARATLAVSPALAMHLTASTGVEVRHLPVPWTVPAAIDPRERIDARRTFGLHADADVVLYAGNLDAYQGLEVLFAALRALPETHLLFATHDPSPGVVEATLNSFDLVDRTRVVPLEGEPCRRALHAAADVVAVPRKADGGLPIKLLEALARGVPVAGPRRAMAGLPLDRWVHTAEGNDPPALAEALRAALQATRTGTARAHVEAARAWVAQHHGPGPFLAALDTACSASVAGRTGARTP